jgi:hypothetical protein
MEIFKAECLSIFLFQILKQIFHLILCEMMELSNIILYRPRLFEKVSNVNYIVFWGYDDYF